MRQISFAPTQQQQPTLHSSSLNPETRQQSRNLTSTTLASAFSSGFITRDRPQDVIFFAGEDLYRDSVVGTRELAIKKYCKLRLDLDDSRSYESYCFEFCGLLNIRYQDVRFVNAHNRQDVPMQRTVKRGVEIYVYSSQANFRTVDIDFSI